MLPLATKLGVQGLDGPAWPHPGDGPTSSQPQASLLQAAAFCLCGGDVERIKYLIQYLEKISEFK